MTPQPAPSRGRGWCTPALRAVAHGVDELRCAVGQDIAWSPLCVVSTPRVGSNLLLDYLRCLPGVSLRGEVLHPSTVAGTGAGRSRSAVLRHLRRSVQAQPGRVRGVKLPLGHLEQRGLDLRDVGSVLDDVRWIVLYRQSLAEQYVSWRCARRTGQWTSRGGRAPQDRPLEVDVDDFSAWVDGVRGRYDAVRRLERGGCWQWLSYEELVADPDRFVGERLAGWLGVPSAPLRTDLRKQAVVPLEQRVALDARVADAFAQTSARLVYEVEVPDG